MNEENNNEEDLPKLNIEQENEFKKLKLNLEHGAIFPDNMSENLPPEVEAMFLDSVMNFENAYQNLTKINVYQKLGSPEFRAASSLSDEEIQQELERIEEIMLQNGLAFDVLADYENENRLIYTFITEELFLHEIDDMFIPGMTTHLIYEDFYPNHAYELKTATNDFLNIFFDTKSDFYEKYHSTEATNHEELNNFRSLFKEIKMLLLDIEEINFDEKQAKVTFKLDFWAKMEGSDAKFNYSGEGSMTFEFEYEYWCVREVNLPIRE